MAANIFYSPTDPHAYTRVPTKDVEFGSFAKPAVPYADQFRMVPDSMRQGRGETNWADLAQQQQLQAQQQQRRMLPGIDKTNVAYDLQAGHDQLHGKLFEESLRVETDAHNQDMKNHKMRAQSFDNYSLVSALIFGFACSAIKWSYGDYLSNLAYRNQSPDSLDGLMRLLYFAHVSIMAVIAALTMYSTMIFVLSGVYTRTGMAIDNLKGLNAFLAELQTQRDMAFKAFILAAVALPMDIIMQALANLFTYGFRENKLIFLMLVPASVIAIFSTISIHRLVQSAGAHIFGSQAITTMPLVPELPDLPMIPEITELTELVTDRTDITDAAARGARNVRTMTRCCL